MIIKRPFWLNLIEEAWKSRNIIWLMGVRRVGKTSLCKSIDDALYLDCERPRTRQMVQDPEAFLESMHGKRVILDEIHRLDNPSELLKICADHYPDVQIIATGSSTLGASAKFKDTLTGRKKEIWLTPLLEHEMAIFGNTDIAHRFLFGGFPSFFTSKHLPEADFSEWNDAYWAKDIQDMFSVGKRYSFEKFTELLLAYSGGQFEATKFAAPCEVTRQTIANYLAVLEETFVVHVIRPYTTHKPTEIIMAPKVYGFDTGFACYAKGWRELRKEDMGLLWEHVVLNELHGFMQLQPIHYWRDKRGHEVDFVISPRGTTSVIAIECKFSSASDHIGQSMLTAIAKNLQAFRANYPDGDNIVVAHDVDMPYVRRVDNITITFIGLKDLQKYLASSSQKA